MTVDLAVLAPIAAAVISVLVQIVILVWFLAGLNARTLANEKAITDLQTDFRKSHAERGELNARLVRVETLLTQVLEELRRSPPQRQPRKTSS